MNDGDRLVAAYVAALEAELADLPRSTRRDVVEEIEAHIAEARAQLVVGDETDVRNLLERVGPPAEIAAEARGRAAGPRVAAGWREVGALILLPVGAIILPLVGWFAGVVLLWVSDAWDDRDKLIGTLVLPGGLAGAAWLMFGLAGTRTCTGGTGLPTRCTGGIAPPFDSLLFGVLLAAPLVADAYLLWRLRRARVPVREPGLL